VEDEGAHVLCNERRIWVVSSRAPREDKGQLTGVNRPYSFRSSHSLASLRFDFVDRRYHVSCPPSTPRGFCIAHLVLGLLAGHPRRLVELFQRVERDVGRL
jgi:hypothetical protein